MKKESKKRACISCKGKGEKIDRRGRGNRLPMVIICDACKGTGKEKGGKDVS